MKVKFMTMSQCKRIIEAGFVGEHDRNGNQVDYADYAEEIQEHYWELRDSRLSEYIIQQYEAVVKGVFCMRSICLMVVLLASSNLSAELRTEKFIAGYKCPDGYYFRLSDRLCHYSYIDSVKSVSRNATVNYPILRKNKPTKVIVKVNPVDAVKTAARPLKIDCTRVMNQCFKGDL